MVDIGLRKGQAPESFKQGKLEKHNFANLSEEERKRISQLGKEAREKNRQERLVLQKCMRELLSMKTTSTKARKILKEFGFDKDEDLTNKTLLMTALFKRGISGDTFAIKEIIEMMDKLDMFEDTEETAQQSQDVVIHIHPVSPKVKSNIDDEWEQEEIRRAENGMSLDVEDWE